MPKILKKIGFVLLSLLFWIAVWIAASLIAGSPLILPSPVEVAVRVFELCATAHFWATLGLTLVRILSGMAAGILLGIILALPSSFSDAVKAVVSPAVTVIRATPVASFIILAMLWLGNRALPSVISAMMILPVVYTDVCTGMSEVRKDYLEVARVFGIRGFGRLKAVYLPCLRPYLVSAMKNAAGLAWKAGVAAEVLSYTPLSVGREIMSSKSYLLTTDLFAWTLTVVILSLIIEKLISFAASKSRKEAAPDD